MVDDGQAKAQKLREDGNAFYKEGKFIHASNAYHNAWKLVPTDPAPGSNLSAVRYEMGDFDTCITTSMKALAMYDESDEAKKQRLFARIAKSNISSLKIRNEDWKSLPEAVRREYGEQISVLRNLWASYPEAATMQEEILLRLPRYRPALREVPEYYSVGHDYARTWFDGKLLKAQPDTTKFLFVGIGDARHFYATLAAVARHERERSSPKDKRHHFTLVDLKASALARDLIIFWLLQELSKAEGQANRDTAVAIFYVFVGTIMPSQAYKKLQSSIAQLTNALETDSQMPDWLFVGKAHRPALIEHLNSWATIKDWTTRSMRSSTHTQHHSDWVQKQMYMGPRMSNRLDGAPPGCRQEMAVFIEVPMLQPPAQYIEDHESKLQPFLLGLQNQSTSEDFLTGCRALETHLDNSWHPNVTLVDNEWQNDRKKSNDFADGDFAHDPLEFWNTLYADSGQQRPGNADCLYDYVGPFFKTAAAALKQLRGRLVVEVAIAEMGDVMERLKYNMIQHRQEFSKQHDPGSFPNKYHRIHMSNVPDYIGGHLTSFLYALPILDPSADSYITSTCLRNTPTFKSLASYTNEYTITTTPPETVQLFGVTLSSLSPLLGMGGILEGESMGFLAGPCDNISWHRVNGRLPFMKLAKNTKVEKWLIAHFLKLALPCARSFDMAMIEAPLNLTAFFRILVHLHGLGYPAHWLSGCRFNDTCRKYYDYSPCTSLHASVCQRGRKELCQSKHRVLPFGLLTQTSRLPKIEDIREFEVAFSKPYGESSLSLNAGLVLFDMSSSKGFQTAAAKNLRPWLLDDEKGEMTADAKKTRDRYIHVLSTFVWNSKDNKATFWLRKDVIDNVKESGTWRIFLWRTTTWEKVSDGVDAVKIREGRRWV